MHRIERRGVVQQLRPIAHVDACFQTVYRFAAEKGIHFNLHFAVQQQIPPSTLVSLPLFAPEKC